MYGGYQLLVLAPLLWMMGTRERMLARAMADQYVGHGFGNDDRFGRAAGPYAGRSGRPSFFARRPDPADDGWRGGPPRGYGDPTVRRFTIRQVGGRLVIETLD